MVNTKWLKLIVVGILFGSLCQAAAADSQANANSNENRDNSTASVLVADSELGTVKNKVEDLRAAEVTAARATFPEAHHPRDK